jgi:hypothetical protein
MKLSKPAINFARVVKLRKGAKSKRKNSFPTAKIPKLEKFQTFDKLIAHEMKSSSSSPSPPSTSNIENVVNNDVSVHVKTEPVQKSFKKEIPRKKRGRPRKSRSDNDFDDIDADDEEFALDPSKRKRRSSDELHPEREFRVSTVSNARHRRAAKDLANVRLLNRVRAPVNLTGLCWLVSTKETNCPFRNCLE